MKLNEILDILEQFAPVESAEEWDNVGLLIGRDGDEIQKILVCLDFTADVLEQAIQGDFQMIITHHPVIFKPLQKITNPLFLKAVRHNICVYSGHTNVDIAQGGVNDVLAEKLELVNVTADGILRVGELKESLSETEFVKHVCKILDVPAVRTVPLKKQIKKVGLVGGAGGDFLENAKLLNCDAYVTGEVSYHVAQAAESMDVFLVCAGHFETEAPIAKALTEMLNTKLSDAKAECAVLQNPFPVTI